MSTLLSNLVKRYTIQTHPDVATTVEQSLLQLSRGIYTEEERFIFELLQNAVDAYTRDDGCLIIKIIIRDNHLIFLHNGEPFTRRDVEGLCDVGNGNKTKDVKKIGYKGIGFKSVFMRSSCVTVESGKYCFKFDKDKWKNYWDFHWNEDRYGKKDKEKKYEMPWQIIPIETIPPIEIDKTGANVITYIDIQDEDYIAQKVSKLMSSNHFLLFLKCQNIQMSFVLKDKLKACISKSTDGEIVSLSKNNKQESRWLIYTNENVEVPPEVVSVIANDLNTPEKLKGVQSFDLSFAIALKGEKKIQRLEENKSVIYTYLPTSFRFGKTGFPFLVNANFITDAGRQQLHKDSEWNKLIFSKIPFEYLNWISRLSARYDNYYEVLPKLSYGNDNALELAFSDSMQKAVNTIAFIPSALNPDLKLIAKDSILDKIGIASSFSEDKFVEHINRTYNKSFTKQGLIKYNWKSINILSEYGTFVFDKEKLQSLFDDNKVFYDIDVDLDIKLIEFLWKYYINNPKDKEELNLILSKTKFLLAEDSSIQVPSSLYFPTKYREENKLAADILLINEELFAKIENKEIIDWLKNVGVRELSNISFIEYLYEHKDYVTVENAIEIGRFIFSIYKKEISLSDTKYDYKLKNILFLSKNGVLKSASDLYLGTFFKPEFDIESVCNEDIFISEDYCKGETPTEWKMFFLKLGVNEDLYITNKSYSLEGTQCNKRQFDIKFFRLLKNASEKWKWIAWDGWSRNSGYSFYPQNIFYQSLSLVSDINTYGVAQLVISRLIVKYVPYDIETIGSSTCVSGTTGFSRVVPSHCLREVGAETNHFKYLITNCEIVPTTQKKNCLAKDVYSNAIPQIKEMADFYLPIIDVDTIISSEWERFLNLKSHITYKDLLEILTAISDDDANADNNKSKVSIIYQQLIEHGAFHSEEIQNSIREWSSDHKLISQSGELLTPCELSYITLEGFSSKAKVYIGNKAPQEDLLKLMQLFGIDIITEDNINPDYQGSIENDELRRILLDKIVPLSLIATGKEFNEEKYQVKRKNLEKLLDQTHFYHCERIILTYGNDNDVVEKHTFGVKNDFYYTGDIRPANVEALMTPLCNYLGLKNSERDLFILFIEDIDGIKQNFMDKGYDVSILNQSSIPNSGTLNVMLNYTPTLSLQQRNIITGFKGEIIIYEKLLSLGYEPICPSISTEDDYDQKVEWNGKSYYCKKNYNNFDISFKTHQNVEMFIEVKATTMNKEYQENMPISYNELSMVEKCNNETDKAYIIARVFGIDSDHQDIYLFKGHILN